jgi:hypothetical protein
LGVKMQVIGSKITNQNENIVKHRQKRRHTPRFREKKDGMKFTDCILIMGCLQQE